MKRNEKWKQPNGKYKCPICGNEFKKRKEHDLKRDQFLNDNGWIVFRITYNEINNNTIKTFIKFLDEFKHSNSNKRFLPKLLKNKELRNTRKIFQFIEDRKRLYNNQKIIDSIMKIEYVIDQVDTTKYGWVGKLAKLAGVSHTQIRRTINKHFTHIGA